MSLTATSSVPDPVRILVVDDTADMREVLETTLAQHGAKVRAAASAAEALETMRQWRPDLLISDIGMPDEDGYALIRKVRQLGPEGGGDVPAIALTSFAQAQDRARALNAGFQLHVPKPVDTSELLTAVANVFARGFTAKLST